MEKTLKNDGFRNPCELLHDDSGMGTVEIILIIVVLITLVLIFKSKIQVTVNKIVDKVDENAMEIAE